MSTQIRPTVSSRNASRLKTLLTAAVAPAAVGTSVDAADLTFDSGPITSGNLLGWNPSAQGFEFNFNVTNNRNFAFGAFFNFGAKRLTFSSGDLNTATFRMATGSGGRGFSYSLQFFSLNQTWAARAADRPYGDIGRLTAFGAAGQVTPEDNVYFLFTFEDSGTAYFGWIDADILVAGNNATGSNYVRINRYAWQSSTLGVLGAGVTPVPEPSTLVTSGIAALAGGAVALRRWRKERKAKTEAA